MRDRSTPLSAETLAGLAWEKMAGLLPCVVQDAATLQVLMLGYMNREAAEASLASGRVTFFSRSKERLWTKGETSGAWLELVSLHGDCDDDALLALARPAGPTCHLGTVSCFSEADAPGLGLLARLEQTIAARAGADPAESYTARLLGRGIKRIAQKVGEEGVETALAAAAGETAELESEAADLVFHLLVLLHAKGSSLEGVLAHLAARQGMAAPPAPQPPA